MWKKIKDLTGKKFGRLTILKMLREKGAGQKTFCLSVCECGNLVKVWAGSLNSGDTKSCGCLQKERVREKLFKHGDSKSNLYHTWSNMKSRCFNLNSTYYKYYGEKGITVCDEWKSSYLNFKFWAILSGYEESLTIDRINSKGDYKPDNCRWITISENVRKSNLEYPRWIPERNTKNGQWKKRSFNNDQKERNIFT